MEYSRIPADIHGYVWISMEILAYPWTRMKNLGYVKISMHIYGYRWTPIHVHAIHLDIQNI